MRNVNSYGYINYILWHFYARKITSHFFSSLYVEGMQCDLILITWSLTSFVTPYWTIENEVFTILRETFSMLEK